MSAAEESIEKRAFGIGWEFVQEYYTIMHHEPQSLYKFYSNDSYFCYGLEGESTQYCHGKEEIKKRISDIDYKECRVVVSNVDSQPSNNGGIIVQVLGELSNKDEQAIKFAQTFFLAVQQNGYYVLNDIFRYLKDEVNEEYEEIIQQPEEEKEEEVKPAEPAKVEEPPVKQEKVEPKKEKVEAKPAPAAEEAKPVPAKEKKTTTEADAAKPQQAPAQKSTPAQKAAPAAKEAAPAAKETPAEAPKPTAAKVAAAAETAKPAAAAPTRPITYSSIASSSAKSWNKVAQGDGTKPATVVVKQAATTATTTQKHQDNRNNNNTEKDSHTVFVKLPYPVPKDEISNALSKFGDIKNVEINTAKNYAFVEFATVEQARKAVQNGEFVINNTKINIEERKRNNKNHGNGRSNSSYNNRNGRSDYNRNYSGGSRGSNDSNNLGSRRGGSNNGKRPYKN